MVESVGSAEPFIGLRLGKRTYFEDVCPENLGKNASFSSDPAASSPKVKRCRASQQGEQISRCQVEGCDLDLTSAKNYHRKHRVCESHSKCPKVIVAGRECRFCQQCSRFHHLSEFDQKKRSCRRRLSDHNARRRKPPASTRVSSSYYALMSIAGLEATSDASNLDGAPDFRRALSLLSTNSCGSADPGEASPIDLFAHLNNAGTVGPPMHLPFMSSGFWQVDQAPPH
ncbi:unnamed protein product [Spirodela intermedia]|uniref:SBP-type domain-containing protein n=1 Tax=Spirodela intermedia TaxID=51605 RepID=A0A7I8LET0_SPIIN|nr:unnamed protein product [Spirodela intermedia]